MTRLFIIVAIMMASASIQHSGAVIVSDAPSSIRHAFLDEHPFAIQPVYRFSSDDAGPFFQVAFEETGTHQSAEFRYTTHDWIVDEYKIIAGNDDIK